MCLGKQTACAETSTWKLRQRVRVPFVDVVTPIFSIRAFVVLVYPGRRSEIAMATGAMGLLQLETARFVTFWYKQSRHEYI